MFNTSIFTIFPYLPKANEDAQRRDERYERDGVAADVQVVNQPPKLRTYSVLLGWEKRVKKSWKDGN